MMDELSVTTSDDGVATVCINRPSKRNAVSLAMWQELGDTFESLAHDDGARVVILTGAGGHFCAGADISEFSEVRADAASGQHYDEVGDRCSKNLMELPKPTIAAVSGYCVGGGCGLALCCDFRVADGSARFGIPAARLGVMYGDRKSVV